MKRHKAAPAPTTLGEDVAGRTTQADLAGTRASPGDRCSKPDPNTITRGVEMPQRKHKARKRAQPPEQRGRKWLYVLAPVVALLIMAGIWFAAKDGQASRPIDAGVTTAETKEPGQGGSRAVELAPASLLTGRVAQAPPAVTGAYRFAIANQDLLSQIPCYCGCVASGHKSNLDCFMQGTNPDGSIIFDDHAFG